MRNPQPSTSVSPPVCAGLELILRENAVVLHEKEKKNKNTRIAHLPRQKFKNCCMFKSYLPLTSGVTGAGEGFIFVFVSHFLHLQNGGECRCLFHRVVVLSDAIYKAF